VLEHVTDPAAEVLDVEPVADLLAVAVDGSGSACRALRIISGMSFSGYWYGP
jgi:hypothetical protein